ncbi:FIG00937980: hypothetical protein [hydrothermal vent metagenome]|uniref:KilA/APSES-type HTH DNA-binding domain-containing protein n=1 Tax=hydrothermal vent metagenome TaxID=652676 RepID=A0A3B0TNY6_9ZZZZ
MGKTTKIKVEEKIISIVKKDEQDYICLTDMLKAKDGSFFITDWLRNRNTLEFLSVWEKINNPNFNYGEFAIIRNQSGLNSFKVSVKEWVIYAEEADLLNVALFHCTAKDWRVANPEYAEKGMNIRDIASINELAVLSNLESLNAEMIKSGISKESRYLKLKEIAMYQLTILNEKDFIKTLKKLNEKVYVENKKKLK